MKKLLFALVCLFAPVAIGAVSITNEGGSTPWAVLDGAGKVISQHQREDKAIERAVNEAEASGATYYVQRLGRARVTYEAQHTPPEVKPDPGAAPVADPEPPVEPEPEADPTVEPPAGAIVVPIGGDLAAAVARVHSGEATTIALERGGEYVGAIGTYKGANLLIVSYGAGPRPRIVTHGRPFVGGTSMSGRLHLIGLWIDAGDRAGVNVNGISGPHGVGSACIIEDCVVRGFTNNIYPGRRLIVRRSAVLDAWPELVDGHRPHSQGIVPQPINEHLEITDCLFDHNGHGNGAPQTVFSHSIYIHSHPATVIIERNTVLRSGGAGIQARSGGIVRDNLIVMDDDSRGYAITFGGVYGGSDPIEGGVEGEITGNTIYGHGLHVANTKLASIAGNRIIGARAYWIELDTRNGDGIRGLTVSGNVSIGGVNGVNVMGSTDNARTTGPVLEASITGNSIDASNLFVRSSSGVGDVARGVFSANSWSGPAAWSFADTLRTGIAKWREHYEPDAAWSADRPVVPARPDAATLRAKWLEAHP